MHEITCPHCHKAFQVDEAGYAAIVKQVRDTEFSTELHSRLEEAAREREMAIQLAEVNAAQAQEGKISELREQLAELKAAKENARTEQELAIANALAELKQESADLRAKLESAQLQKELAEKTMKEQHESDLRAKDELIAQYKDLKARLSTKMVGESLEQHCESQFNQLRATGFAGAYFEKDNDAKGGSKGDYIFRDFDEDGLEYISIMFEMKNEQDETSSKKKNEDFFKELDKDRNEKGCEYAVLVSMLEMDSELYGQGIVDVSHRYPKMYVIRPQFFIPMITLLRNAAQKSIEVQAELHRIQEENLDITNFEAELSGFQDSFGKYYNKQSEKVESAIDEIDKAIKNLEKVKSELAISGKNLGWALREAENLSIKKLTKNSPTLKERFKRGSSVLGLTEGEDAVNEVKSTGKSGKLSEKLGLTDLGDEE
jgi:hypothetical protein